YEKPRVFHPGFFVSVVLRSAAATDLLGHAVPVDDHGFAVAMGDADGDVLVTVTPGAVVMMLADTDADRADADPYLVRIRRNCHRDADGGEHSQCNRTHVVPPDVYIREHIDVAYRSVRFSEQPFIEAR